MKKDDLMEVLKPLKHLIKKVEVWVQEIKGINYYIDNEYNVYKHEDILKNLTNPEKLARYTCIDGVYNIPEFGI